MAGLGFILAEGVGTGSFDSHICKSLIALRECGIIEAGYWHL